MEILRGEKLARLGWLVHGFSTKRGGFSRAYGGGALNLGFTKQDARAAVERNRAAFLKALGAVDKRGRSWPLVTLRQVHSATIHYVEREPKERLAGDGLITDQPGLLLAVQTADCLPVVVVDPKHRAVGVFHAGWRGALARIVEKGVGEMRRRFASDPRRMQAAIGPGIHQCCYEVSEELRDQFESQFAYAGELFETIFESDEVRERYPLLFMTARAPGHHDLGRKPHLDLVEANRRQLLDAGLPAGNIEVSPLCTACEPERFFSYRATKGETGRLMGVVGIRG
ncbi:MAG TPA: peptidoglycan editing factor PgeF [Terriglobales bacterium]|nr:peptidoglycan editing factor PgeF [Terriglobales bacterium]